MNRLSLLKRIETLEKKVPGKRPYLLCLYEVLHNLVLTGNKEEFKQILKAEKQKAKYASVVIENDITKIDIFEDERINKSIENQLNKVIFVNTKDEVFKKALKGLYQNVTVIQDVLSRRIEDEPSSNIRSSL